MATEKTLSIKEFIYAFEYYWENQVIMPHYHRFYYPLLRKWAIGNTEVQISPVTKALWDAYQWNPPGIAQDVIDRLGSRYARLLDVDPRASPKPTWEEIIATARLVVEREVEIVRKRRLRVLRNHCEKRICDKAFGANSLVHEIQIRNRLSLTNGQIELKTLLEMNKWRDHYRARYHEIKAWLNSAPSSDVDSIENLGFRMNFSRDDQWNGATWMKTYPNEIFDAHEDVPEYVDNVPMASSPPFDLELSHIGATAGTIGVHEFKIKGTTKATIELSADAADIVFKPVQIMLPRAGSARFTATGSSSVASGRTIKITATASPYGVATVTSETVANW